MLQAPASVAEAGAQQALPRLPGVDFVHGLTDFLSPSSCSSFIRNSTAGKVYWIGNISRVAPSGNSPRYPLIIAELDEEKLGLRRQRVTFIDDRAADDPPELQLSNFSLVEDTATGHIVLTMDRHMSAQHPRRGRHTYVIEVK